MMARLPRAETGDPAPVAGWHTAQERMDMDEQAQQAHHALYHAAERIAQAEGPSRLAAHKQATRGKATFVVIDSPSMRRVVDGMYDLQAGRITPEQAMGLLWEHDVLRDRLSVPR